MKFKTAFVLSLLLVVTPVLWAANPQAVLSSLKGKVEVKAPGQKAWVPATEGQTLSPAATLSTGFDSSVVVVIDKTTIQVKPLTRMTIDKLVEESGTVKTSTFLRVGSVSASVKSAEGVKQDFKVQSPYSTASVRGTEFDFDGLKLKVQEGLVVLILGRPKRDVQPVEVVEEKADEAKDAAKEGDQPAADATAEKPAEETPAEETPAEVDVPEDDFAGAPDVEASESEGIPVGAGQDVEVKVSFSGEAAQTSSSNDQSSLEESSSGAGAETGTTKVPTKGSVKLTIQFKS